MTFCFAVGGTAITLRRGWRRHKGLGERDDDCQQEGEDDYYQQEGEDDDDEESSDIIQLKI